MGAPSRTILILLLAVAAGFSAYFASKAWRTPDPPVAPVAAAAPALPGPVIPERRPDVSLQDREGKLRALSEWDGRPQIINFWATWCAPCRREIPMLNALARDPAFAEFVLIGIAIDFREDVIKFLEETPIHYPLLIGEQDGLDASRAFGMQSLGLPATAFIDKSGRIVTIHLGELRRPQAEVILGLVREVDAGTIDLKTAQARIRSEVPKIG